MFDLMRGFESHQGEEAPPEQCPTIGARPKLEEHDHRIAIEHLAEILEWLEGSERLPEHKALLAQYSAVETQFFFYSDREQFRMLRTALCRS
ncbi:hypothetical protein HFO27_30675 [Rhizobium leguminosarum]|uniref:hypothetical protein n=1 Tax=Rhizobium leguminosarum TaxID=384 RepID=UPI001C900F60|nr:hypothetical protein [Rhizobium leguminosarum]MBY3178926.1 hypothetical protein [Rhizobium leguminosarum]MBY5623965.1 hypothetical protein [Rhizobium leguminosarum]MBY5645752.1 hypothetical protein [Rhizobium leguminosarum]